MKNLLRSLVFVFILSDSLFSYAQGGGTDCASAVTNTITLPYSGRDSTCGATVLPIVDDYNLPGVTCVDPLMTQGPEWVYYFCATTTGEVNITLDNFFSYCYDPINQPFVYPSVSVWQGCPNTGTCVAGTLPNYLNPANYNGVSPLDFPVSLQVTAGQCYYILVDGYPGYCPCYKYDINVAYVPVPAIQAGCSTIGFAPGTFSGWKTSYGHSVTSGATGAPTPTYTPAYYGVNAANHVITSGAGVDPYGGFPIVYPGGGGFSARIGNLDTAAYGGASIEQSFTVTSANSLFTYYYAVVIEDAAAHNTYEQPFFKAEVFDCSGNLITCAQYLVVGGPSIPGFTLSSLPSPITGVFDVYYKGWTPVSFNLTPYVGSCVKIKYTVSDCAQGAHFAYAYVDADCRTYEVEVEPQTCPTDPVLINGPFGFENYAWTGPGIVGSANQQNITVNASGIYHLDMNIIGNISCGSSLDTNVAVTILAPLSTTPASTPATCGVNNGSASVTVATGGTPGYNYTWSNGTSGMTASSLGAGTYTVSVIDANGCVLTSTATVTAPGGPTATMGAQTNVTCSAGNNGVANVTAASGTTPYTYTWSNGASTTTTSTTNQVTGLAAGNYIVTVRDASGCTSTSNVTITAPPVLTATSGSTDATCGANDGTVNVSAGGGTGTLSYSWTGGSTAQTVTGLGSGSYIVTVTDANSCTITTTAAVGGTGGPAATMGAPTNILCNAGATGIASVTVTSGAGTYTYSWSNAVTATTTSLTNSITGLVAGSYIVTVSDGGPCPTITNVTITEPPALSVTASSTQATCGSSDGSATVTNTTGGTAGYNYLWNNAATGLTATGLAAGPYVVTVTDANSCTALTNVVVTNTTGPTATGTPTNVTCFGGSNGSASVLAANTTGAVSYLWNTTATGATITNLAAGSYTVTVDDASACNAVTVVTITQPARLQMGAGSIAPTCFGSCNGQAVAAPQGWTPTTVLWSNGGSGIALSNLCIGTYSVTATDANGCTKDTSVTLTQPTAITVTGSTTNANCNQSNGSATVTGAGGTPTLTYLWSNGITTALNNNIASGTHSVTVTDLNGCTHDTSMTVQTTGGVTASIPTTQSTSCFSSCTGSATAQGTGSSGYNYLWSNGQVAQTINSLCAGIYSVTITDVNNCTSIASASITEPPVLTLQVNQPNIVCPSTPTVLSGFVTPSGGTPAYTYSWSSGATVSPTSNTTYTFSVTDANGCSTTQTITVTTVPPMTLTVSPALSICPGGSAQLSANVSGGAGNYIYNWQPGGITTATLTAAPTADQTYTVTINDGCSSIEDVIPVTLYAVPQISFTLNQNSGCAPVCINFQDNSTIGTGSTIIGWLWDFGDGTTSILMDPSKCFSTAGTYSVSLTVSSDRGCTASDTPASGVVTVFGGPTAEFTTSPTRTTILDPTFNFIDQSSGTGSLTYAWDFGDNDILNNTSTAQNPSHTYNGNDTGTYMVQLIVTDAQGCIDTVEHPVHIEGDFAFYIPNAFSPNRDGINDTFNGKGVGIKKYKMMVFDRWGNLIYVTESLNLDWDGRANGGDDVAQQDVYVWKVALTSIFDKKYNYIGHVTLVK